MKVAVVGGGAAGFFAASAVKQHHPDAEVHLLEKSSKTLSKVKISGGGRCNVTHDCLQVRDLMQHYPRGGKFLKAPFRQFNVNHTIQWFEERGVQLKTESDGRMFPTTNSSETIIEALTGAVTDAGVLLRLNAPVSAIQPNDDGVILHIGSQAERFDRVIIASGGSPKRSGLEWLEAMGQPIIDPVPSLFTFNLPKHSICSLPGVAVTHAVVWLEGERWRSEGPLLITHWGLSGPAVLKASAIAARTLAESNYANKVHVNWVGGMNDIEVLDHCSEYQTSQKKLSNAGFPELPTRLWVYLLGRAELDPDVPWKSIGKKAVNRIVEVLTNDVYEMKGKTTFKEEFVTAGGVALSGVDPKTMRSKHLPNVYFAGEVLDIDGFTGGFNFQAAWTTAWVAGQLA
jgi:hypothetical protein